VSADILTTKIKKMDKKAEEYLWVLCFFPTFVQPLRKGYTICAKASQQLPEAAPAKFTKLCNKNKEEINELFACQKLIFHNEGRTP